MQPESNGSSAARICLGLIASWLLMARVPVYAEVDLSWCTIDGGGELWVAGGDFELSGTIGQSDANEFVMSGGGFELIGGFWAGVASAVPVAGDCDGDGDMDLDDFADLEACLLGPDNGLDAGCECADFDNDADIDLRDFAVFQMGFTGS